MGLSAQCFGFRPATLMSWCSLTTHQHFKMLQASVFTEKILINALYAPCPATKGRVTQLVQVSQTKALSEVVLYISIIDGKPTF